MILSFGRTGLRRSFAEVKDPDSQGNVQHLLADDNG
jgi:hypothetical protein